MILVLFGTNPYQFERLAQAVQDFVNITQKDVVVQLGNTISDIPGAECYDFMPRPKLISFIEKADIIITQGGFGSIADCLQYNKKIVAVPRRRELKECKDDAEGQVAIVRELEGQGKLVGVYDIKDLQSAIKKVYTLKPQITTTSKIPTIVADFVKSVFGEKL
ncbi:glycosyltransferase [Candidatus Omnitrophota bacterium]